MYTIKSFHQEIGEDIREITSMYALLDALTHMEFGPLDTLSMLIDNLNNEI